MSRCKYWVKRNTKYWQQIYWYKNNADSVRNTAILLYSHHYQVGRLHSSFFTTCFGPHKRPSSGHHWFNRSRSKYATHLLENHHSIGPIDEVMQIVYTTGKCRFMDTIEKFPIYKQTQLDNQINDRDTVKYNAILDTLVQQTTHRAQACR
jgi:hypothetical protein